MTEKRNKTKSSLRDNKKLPLQTTSNSGAKASHVPMHDLVGEKLRAYYDQMANEPVPDRFELLLKQLEAKNKEEKSA